MAYEYTSWLQQAGQSWAPFWKWIFGIQPWYPPHAPPIPDRWLDTTPVGATTPTPWPDTHADLRLGTAPPSTFVWANCMPGLPIQRVSPDAPLVTVREHNTYSGVDRDILVPLPQGGEFWTEGNPCIGGGFDKHVLLVCPETATSWEMIGFTASTRMCLASAVYVDGQLADGMPVCRGQASMTSVLLQRGDPVHRLAIAMNNYSSRPPSDGTEPWPFPHPGDVVALPPAKAVELLASDLTAEQRIIVRSLVDHGAVVYDRAGGAPFAALGIFGGAQWAGTTIGDLDIRVGDLELVVA